MIRTLLAAATMAALLPLGAYAQETVQATGQTYAGRVVICTSQFNKRSGSEDPKDKEAVKVGKAYFIKECNRQLCHAEASKNPSVKCRS